MTLQKNYQDKRRIRIVLNNTSSCLYLFFFFFEMNIATPSYSVDGILSLYTESQGKNRKIFWLGGYVLKDLMIELPQTQRI